MAAKKKTRVEELQDYAKGVGLTVRTWSPGDGTTRYRFFDNPGPGQTYFGPASGTYTALGLKDAWNYVYGYGGGRSGGRGHATKRDRAEELIASYGTWTSSYSNEDLDRTAGLANRLTDIDRQEGRPAPPVGYSKQRYEQAKRVVADANTYGKKQQRLRASRSGSSHARKKKISPQEAKQLLASDGIDFGRDFHELSSYEIQRLLEIAKLAGYRKRPDAPGSTARMFYQYLSRQRAHATKKGASAKHTVYDLVEVNNRTGKERVLHEHFSTKEDAEEARAEYRGAGRTGVGYRIRSRKIAAPPYRWNPED